MQKVNELITLEKSFFGAFQSAYNDLYTALFEQIEPSDMDMNLLVSCGERYAAPLLTHYEMNKVVNFVVNKYGENWKRVKAALTAEYDIMKPYKVTQVTTGEKTANSTNSGESTNTTGVVAFDSETATDSEVDKNTNSATAEQTENSTTTVENSGTTGNVSHSDLITNEIEVRKNSFIQLVINDIQTQITLDIY